jgi:hypothetical protein
MRNPSGHHQFLVGGPEKACRTYTIKYGMTWRFAKRLRKKLVWAFELPSKKPSVGPKIENEIVLEMAATA